MLPNGLRIAVDQPPGRYEVDTRVLRHELDRQAAKNAAGDEVLADQVFTIDVTP
jgi:hypothetical protein